MLEPLERRCAMDAAIGDWVTPREWVMPIHLSPSETSAPMNVTPIASIDQDQRPEEPTSSSPSSTLPSHELPSHELPSPDVPSHEVPAPDLDFAVMPYGPQVPVDWDWAIDSPTLDAGEQATEPFVENPPNQPIDLGTNEFEKSTDGDSLTAGEDGTGLLDEDQGETGKQFGDLAMSPGLVRFVSVESPTMSLSLTGANDDSLFRDLHASVQADVDDKAAKAFEGHVDGDVAKYSPQGALSLTPSRYFESKATDALWMRPLLTSKEIASSLRRITPRNANDDTNSGMRIGAIATHSPTRSRPRNGDAQSEEAATFRGRTAERHEKGDLLVTTSEALVDLALMALVGESENGSKFFAGVVTPAANATAPMTNRTVAKTEASNSCGGAESKDRVSITEFARNLSRLAVLGFVLSQGATQKTVRLGLTHASGRALFSRHR